MVTVHITSSHATLANNVEVGRRNYGSSRMIILSSVPIWTGDNHMRLDLTFI